MILYTICLIDFQLTFNSVGNKVDLELERKVTVQEGKDIAKGI
jgi:hypothetical protein